MATFDELGARAASTAFTFRQVECLIAVAETGSVSKAAERLHASSSAVLDSISSMERSLGVSLFHRQRSRGSTLTSDGLAVIPIARRLINDAEELAASVGPSRSALVGPVRIGVLDTLAPIILPRVLQLLAKRYPGIRLEYRLAPQDVLVDALAADQLDALIVYDIDIPPELERRTLLSTVASALVAADHPFAGRSEVSLEELGTEPMVLLDIAAARAHLLELMSSRSISPRIAYRTDNYDLCRAMVGRGLGYTILMRRSLDPGTWDGGQVRYVPIFPPPRAVQVLAVWPRGRLAPRVGAVVDLSAEVGDASQV